MCEIPEPHSVVVGQVNLGFTLLTVSVQLSPGSPQALPKVFFFVCLFVLSSHYISSICLLCNLHSARVLRVGGIYSWLGNLALTDPGTPFLVFSLPGNPAINHQSPGTLGQAPHPVPGTSEASESIS